MKIMVCYDGSDRSTNALEKTLELFKDQAPEIMLLMVADTPGDASMENEEASEAVQKDCHASLRSMAESVADRGFEVDAILATGDPRNMIVEAIENKNPDLVVVAKRGRSSVDRILLGSVSTYVVNHSTTPVLVVQKVD